MPQLGFDLEGIDPELLRAAAAQPALDYVDPVPVRAKLRSAFTISRRLRAGSADDAKLRVSDRLIPARSGSPDIPVRLYEPLDRDPGAAGLVFFHGGGFVAGDLDTEDERCRGYAHRTGTVVLSVDYRLAPEHPFPAAFEDCYDSLVWLSAHAVEQQVDPARIAVGGSSAGGALAAAVALAARDHDGPRIAAQLLLYPVTDDRLATGSMARCTATPGWNQPNSVHMWRHYLGEQRQPPVSPYAAPARAEDLSGLPPAYVLTVEHDPLRDEGIAYALRLIRSGVPTELHNLPAAFHGFDAAAPQAGLSRLAMAEQCAILASTTRASQPERPDA